MLLQFDEHGHLRPYKITELTLLEFESFFVEGLPDQSHRRMLFEKYLLFVADAKAIFNVPFHQWVAGSFITSKEFPDDIDVVTFLPYDEMARKSTNIHHFKTFGKEIYRIDASFSPVCKWNHRFFETSLVLMEDYLKLYSFSRPDKYNQRSPKGIIKLNFLL